METEFTKMDNFLHSFGCCSNCLPFFSGNYDLNNFRSNEKFSDLILDIGDEFTKYSSSNGCKSGNLKTSNGYQENLEQEIPINKKKKIEYNFEKADNCICCLGLFEIIYDANSIRRICKKIKEAKFDVENFSLGVSLPVCFEIRIHSIWAHLLQHFPTYKVHLARKYHIGSLKDVWRTLTGNNVSAILNKNFDVKNPDFNVSIELEYEDDLLECSLLELLDKNEFTQRKLKHRKYNEGVFTKAVVENTLKSLDDKKFLELTRDKFPSMPKNRIKIKEVEVTRDSIWIAGRYKKYSRELPQSPWFIDGVRKLESSVSELICDRLKNSIRFKDYTFSGCGREDVDVRCLGQGRPFLIECQNPEISKFSKDEVKEMERMVNDSTSLVQIRDLQLVSKEEKKNIRLGEIEKQKNYCALCFSRNSDLDYDQITKKISGKEKIVLNQKTPIRVLHRRANMFRTRTVHSLTIEPVDNRFFKVFLLTDGGTYVKEFIHGDFGRTNPNLSSILGFECDIIALDVQDVLMDWPPCVE